MRRLKREGLEIWSCNASDRGLEEYSTVHWVRSIIEVGILTLTSKGCCHRSYPGHNRDPGRPVATATRLPLYLV